jgi:deoxyribonuclease-2
MLAALLLAALSTASAAASSAPVCLDPAGRAVDFWFAYKLNSGTTYVYVDNATQLARGAPLTLSGGLLDDPGSPLARTLAQLIAGRASLARVMWNDELPAALSDALPNATSSSGTSGHTKGVMGASADGGFLLSHSWPKFPDLTGPAVSWGGSTIYAQTFLCLSLESDQFEEAAAGMQFADPYVYDSAVPSGLSRALPATAALVAGQRQGGTRVKELATRAGARFLQVSKAGATGLDIYEDVLQPYLRQDMYVETWRRSPMMDSYCRPQYPYDSLNVQGLTFLDESGEPFALKYTQDHSKLAVTAPGSSPGALGNVSCAGDMNRMTSQWARGGSSLCLIGNAPLHAAFLASMTSVDSCA